MEGAVFPLNIGSCLLLTPAFLHGIMAVDLHSQLQCYYDLHVNHLARLKAFTIFVQALNRGKVKTYPAQYFLIMGGE